MTPNSIYVLEAYAPAATPSGADASEQADASRAWGTRCSPGTEDNVVVDGSAWNPLDNEPYVQEILHDVALASHVSNEQAEAYCAQLDDC